MASSKLPVYFIPVPEKILNFAKQHTEVLCNLRPGQREEVPAVTEMEIRRKKLEQLKASFGDDYWVDKPVQDFLRTVSTKIRQGARSVRVVLHFQGYGEEAVGTAVVDITNILWAEDDYPRLDFVHPAPMQEIHGCPNFWGAFILAIAPVNSEVLFAKPDRTGEEFMNAFTHGGGIQ
ncbi:MAG: hypothetical protein ABSF47_04065 [Minisyncoccia bacterium]